MRWTVPAWTWLPWLPWLAVACGGASTAGPAAAPSSPDGARRALAAEVRALLDAPLARPARQEPRVEGVRLELTLGGSTPLEVGDVLDLSVSVVNESDGAIRVALPGCGGWERFGSWSIELLDEAGEPVPRALGWYPDSLCGELAEPRVVTVEPGASAPLDAPPELLRRVLPSARPGAYRMRVGYLNDAFGATPMSVASNEVSLVVRGGDPRLWQCRLDQYRAIDDMRMVRSEGPALVPIDPNRPEAGLLVLYGREALGGDEPSRIVIASLDAAGHPRGEPQAVAELRGGTDPRRIAAARTAHGVVVATELEHARLSVLVVEVGASGAIRAAPARELGPTYPELVALDGRGDRVAVVYGDVLDGALRLALLDGRGQPLRPPVDVSPRGRVRPDRVAVALDAEGGWIAASDRRDRIWIRRFGLDGALGDVQTTLLSGAPSALRASPGGVEIAYVDSVSGREPGDVMGFFVARVSEVGATVDAPRGLSPTEAEDPHPGAIAWSGTNRAVAYLSGQHALVTRLGAQPPRRVSETARSEVAICALGDRFAVAWADTRDDVGPSCVERGGCVSEIYTAIVGGPSSTVTRVTADARPEPVPIVDEGWERWCPPATGGAR